MPNSEYLIALFLGCVIVLTGVMPAGAQQLVLKNFVLDNVGERIQLRFGLEVEEMKKLQNSLENGGRVRMQCSIYLRRQRGWWPDSTVAQKTFCYDLKNNPLTQTYSMVNCQTDKKFSDNSLQELIQKNWTDITLDLGPWSVLHSGSSYFVEMNLQLKRPDVPAWLKTALFFWSWDVLASQTYRMQFMY
ncbi:MAG: DUF4390 domain-containing protein [Desulfovermiculus sp.]